ncbi:MAG TPA: putative Ig domain-containing protein [Steroidobacteraceae bacterium]|nr:putative Ig domain-containing protein [Steroidobacteraceae bacterium]
MRYSNIQRPARFRQLAICVCALAAALGMGAAHARGSHWWRYRLTISGTPPTTDVAGTAYSFTPTATDSRGYTLTFSISGKPAWASFNSASGQLSGTPTAAGSFANIVISVSDGVSSASLAPFTITVSAPPTANTAPTISGAPATTGTVGTAYAFTPKASDTDGDALTFSIQNKPSWASFSAATGTLSGTPSTAGTYSSIVISVSDGQTSASLAPFSITVSAPAVANTAPTISGTPSTTDTAGTLYTFTPKAGDTDGDPLSFSVQNKPSWATFSIATGTLSGTPTSSGTFSSIVISVSDGYTSASLAPFSINVTQPVTSGSATLSWTAPVNNTDGSALTDLAGYRIHYGSSPSALSTVIDIANAGATGYTIGSLTSGTWYFAVSAYTTSGLESTLSNTGSKSIP